MKDSNLLECFISPEYARFFETLYGPDAAEAERLRYASLVEGFSSRAGFPADCSGDLRVFSAPGRTELCGNHTDHNRGRVLAASVRMDAVAVAAPRRGRRIFFRSAGFPDAVVNLEDNEGRPDLCPKKGEEGTTGALIRGIAAEFAQRGDIGGFCANASSAVLQGSGLSSSAALEVLVAKIFDSLFQGGRRSALELAQISQKAENDFFGKPCGLMDQAASACGGAVFIDFADPGSVLLKKIPFDPMAAGLALCVVNTRGSHAGLTADYAAIPREMGDVARYFGKKFLRELELSQVLAAASEIRKTAGDRALLRAIHFFNEDRRAAKMAALLEESGPRDAAPQLLELVGESGDSSWELLQNIYSPGDAGVQGLSLALAVSREFFRARGIKAACRVHGGGFAGTIQAYVPVESIEDYRAQMEALFGPGALTRLMIRQPGAVEFTKE
ncbi:MAG: galactokinase [Treponema sp.]|jgi:galactokinase|nr:galactokinase [Treponema sp.]